MSLKKLLFAAAGMAGLAAAPAYSATEIQWWHAMTGANAERVNAVSEAFNKSQSNYKVVPVFKGSYPETMTAGIAAFRAGKAPHIIQVFDVGTGTMMAARGAIKPVYEVMAEAGKPFDPKVYLPSVIAYYSTQDGKMLSFPFNSSSPILYYNKDLFKKAGLDPEKPPKTYPEVFDAARKIKAAGAAPCGLTSAWMTWIGLENFSAWHNIPYATQANGLKGLNAELKFNSPTHVRHIQNFADLQKEGVFSYGGRTSESKTKFINGECAIYLDSSGGIGDIIKAGINFGTGPLPYYPDVQGAPQNTVPGGASLWVMGGHKKEEYKGVGEFFHFLSQTPVQVELHQLSGYLPITPAAYEETKKSGWYDKNPGREQPVLQMSGKPPTDNSRAIRLGNLVQIRAAIDEEIENMLAGKQDAKQALDRAVERGNQILRQFEKDNKQS